MNVLQSLTELYNAQDQDSIFKELARQILCNLDQMKRITIYDVAELTNSSRSTVWRLVQKLGYPSFSDFKFALQSAASQYVYYNRMIDRRLNAAPETLFQAAGEQLREASDIFSQTMSAQALEELVDLLSQAGSVHFYMPFRSAFIYSLQQNLWQQGIDSEYCCLVPDMLEAALHLGTDSIVLMSTIEFTETMDMTGVFEAIQAQGARIWLMGHTETRYEQYVERRLLVSDAKPAAWLLAFESFILALSERYRGKYIDRRSQ